MAEENACPHCGASLPSRGDASPTGAKPHAESPIEDEVEPAPVELLASGSNDETFLANPFGPNLVSAQPDPILGGFVTPSSREFSEASAATADRAHRPQTQRRDGPEPAFPSLNFDGASRPAKGAPPPDLDEEDDLPERRNSWVSILMLSYASAITLALVWTLWKTPRVREAPAPAEAPATEELPTVGRQAGRSRKVDLPEPVLSRQILPLKKPLQLGSLEVTPLEVRRERVALQRASFSGKVDRRDGGKNALVLRLKLRNTSKDEVFAPLDQAFLREQQEKKLVDSFLETGAGERVYPFPLAVESEWAIVGQEFGELRPGETRVVTIVSAPDAPGDEAGPFTWRVRLRTGIDRTDVIGVRWPDPAAARSK